jgi:hypothetical protein
MTRPAELSRRRLLQLLGLGSTAAAASVAGGQGLATTRQAPPVTGPNTLGFKPLRPPLPLPGDGLSAAQQRQSYRTWSIEDRVVVPEGYKAELLAVWGDRLADGRFGFNNDYLALTPLTDNRALLSVNFEYISPLTWADGASEAMGSPLPLAALQQALTPHGGSIDATALPAGDPLRALVDPVAQAAMADLGIGVLELETGGNGSWRRLQGSGYERRIDGLTPVACSGPAAAVFANPAPLGYRDGLGARIRGTLANCAGGTTPWGTVLSAEENVQSQVSEAVFADGSATTPSQRPFRWDGNRLDGLGNPFGLAGNKYGWMVEFDPRQPQQPAVKHSWLGRFRHEAVAVVAQAGEPLIVYSGCDRHGGHLYRFVSEQQVVDPSDPRNSRLFEQGRLEVARFERGGSGQWLVLEPATRLAPQRPSHYQRFGVEQPTLLPHGDRRRSGAQALASDAEVDAYCQRHATLADLYPLVGDDRDARLRQQGAILIDAHLAANAIGATAAARPEDTEIDPVNGDLLIAFTAAGRGDEGGSDPAIFQGPAGQANWPHGWVMRLSDGSPERGARFNWQMEATGGTPWQGGLGFSNPDNLAFDPAGNLWLTTDRSSSASLDVFGNNSCWVLPRRGAAAGQALCFALGPVDCELCGPCFDASGHTLFLAVQHPGETQGTRRGQDLEAQAHSLVDRSGRSFEQLRWVPLGSNWPSGVPGQPPRPGVVAISRRDGAPLISG